MYMSERFNPKHLIMKLLRQVKVTIMDTIQSKSLHILNAMGYIWCYHEA